MRRTSFRAREEQQRVQVPPELFEVDALTEGTQRSADTLAFPLGTYILDVKAN